MEHRKSGRAEPHYYSDRLRYKLGKMCLAPLPCRGPLPAWQDYSHTEHLETRLPRGTPVYWFTATDEILLQVLGACREIEKIDSHLGERLLKIELPSAATIGETADALRSIRCKHEAYLVIDDFQMLPDLLPPAFYRLPGTWQ